MSTLTEACELAPVATSARSATNHAARGAMWCQGHPYRLAGTIFDTQTVKHSDNGSTTAPTRRLARRKT